MKQWLIIIWCVVSVQQSTAQEADFTPLQQKIQSWVDSGYYTGASILVAKDNKVIYQHYFGNYQAGTVAYIASAGKWLAAATVAAVVDEGRRLSRLLAQRQKARQLGKCRPTR